MPGHYRMHAGGMLSLCPYTTISIEPSLNLNLSQCFRQGEQSEYFPHTLSFEKEKNEFASSQLCSTGVFGREPKSRSFGEFRAGWAEQVFHESQSAKLGSTSAKVSCASVHFGDFMKLVREGCLMRN